MPRSFCWRVRTRFPMVWWKNPVGFLSESYMVLKLLMNSLDSAPLFLPLLFIPASVGGLLQGYIRPLLRSQVKEQIIIWTAFIHSNTETCVPIYKASQTILMDTKPGNTWFLGPFCFWNCVALNAFWKPIYLYR